MNFLETLQKKPIRERKIILWIVVIVIGLILGTVWTMGVSNNIQKIRSTDIQKNLNIPEIPKLEL